MKPARARAHSRAVASLKRPNPQDTTLRNARASQARDTKLAAKVKALTARVDELERQVRILLPLDRQ